jgi:LEA14-like dessication related protein
MNPFPLPRRRLLLALPLLAVAGCAVSPLSDPPRVELAGIDALQGEGLELRFMLRLRVQNPNDADLAYDGISVDLDLRGKRFASGVAPIKGQVPRFGEAVLNVPVTAGGFAIARQMLDLLRQGQSGAGLGKVSYALRGKIGGAGLGGVRFEASGEVDLSGLDGSAAR